MKILSIASIASLSVFAAFNANAESFHAPMATICGQPAPGLEAIPPHPHNFRSNYVLTLRFFDHEGKLIAQPFPELGYGFKKPSRQFRIDDFIVQSGGNLKATPVCTGFAWTTFVDPASETEANVHVAVEHSFLPQDIWVRRNETFSAPPSPTSLVVERTALLKSGDTFSFETPGDPDLSRIDIIFQTFKP